MNRFIRFAIAAFSAALSLMILGATPARAQGNNWCVVEFSDHFALTNMFGQARGQFAAWTNRDALNRAARCTSLDQDQPGQPPHSGDPLGDGCWMYRQPCGDSGYLRVEPSIYSTDYGHLHMDFADQSLRVSDDQMHDCTCRPSADRWMDDIDDYSVGYGHCPKSPICPDWASEPRAGIHPHSAEDSVVFYMDNHAPFDMADIIISGDRAAVAMAWDGEQVRYYGPLFPGWSPLMISNAIEVVVFDWQHFYLGSGGGPIGIVETYVLAPGGQLDLAYGMTATQSSTLGSGTADRAVDGNEDGNWYGGSVTHTNFEAASWQVDLGGSQRIGRVDILNRTDCCSDRLSNFDVLLSEDGTTWPQALHVPGVAASKETADFHGLRGRYVRIKLRNPNYLSLAEVKVYAGPPPAF